MTISEELEAKDAKHAERLHALGVSKEAEKAVIEWLQEIGALESCYGSDGSCSGSCSSGYYYKKLHNNNCLCVKR